MSSVTPPTELDQCCYRVASVVGLLSIEIFGTDPGCRSYAVHLGKRFN